MTRDVFISHSSRDRSLASMACVRLESHGLKCWIAPRDILPGQPWGESIVRALDECPVLVLLLTVHANGSRHVIREVERADGKLARIITFRIDDLTMNPSLEYFLSAEHWLDAVSRPIEAHLPTLVATARAMRRLGRRPDQVPAPRRDELRVPAINDHELADAFDELAPDNWNRAPKGKLAGYLQALFDDR